MDATLPTSTSAASFRALLWLTLAALFVSFPAALSGGAGGVFATLLELPLVLLAIPLTFAVASCSPTQLKRSFAEGAIVFSLHAMVVVAAVMARAS